MSTTLEILHSFCVHSILLDEKSDYKTIFNNTIPLLFHGKRRRKERRKAGRQAVVIFFFFSLSVMVFVCFCNESLLQSEKRIKFSLKRERNLQKMLTSFAPVAPLENHPKEMAKM